jgi:hypothetical protein
MFEIKFVELNKVSVSHHLNRSVCQPFLGKLHETELEIFRKWVL